MTLALRPSLAALFGSGALLLGASTASALLPPEPAAPISTCETHADCGKGMLCTVVSASTCPGMACPDGADCPPPPPCVSDEIKECVPGAACETDADCGADMVCLEQTEGVCSGGMALPTPMCPPDSADCFAPPPPEPPQCVETTHKECAPKYEAPCTVAADCGAGFDCVESQSCGCSAGMAGGEPMAGGGSAGAGSSGDSAGSGSDPAPSGSGSSGAAAPLPPECFCESTGIFQCVPQDITCTSDSDCPVSWTCEEYGGATSVDCAGPAPSLDGGVPAEPVCTPVAPAVEYRCAPPYGYYGPDRGAVGTGSLGEGVSGNPTSDPIPPGVPQQNVAEDDAVVGSNDSGDDGGCQMGRGKSGSTGALLLGMLGLFAATRRRRVTIAR